jgi:uncharacterized protein (DUF302 family)
MGNEERTTVAVERVTLSSSRSFDDVLDGIYQGIGRPDFNAFLGELAAARSFDEYVSAVHYAVGPADLLRFLEIDEGSALARNPDVDAYRMVRIIAGNPLTMSEMAQYVPEAGSYAPVTILVYEAHDGVRVCYDTVASELRPYEDERALTVAEQLDGSVLAVLRAATQSAEE